MAGVEEECGKDATESSVGTIDRARLRGLGRAFVRQVAAGVNHSMIETASGEVFACGSNDRGQLGLGTACGDKVQMFVKVPLLEHVTAIERFALGLKHSLILSESLQVLGAGGGEFVMSGDDVNTFQLLNTCNIVVVDISADLYHSAVVASSGEVHSWGRRNTWADCTVREPEQLGTGRFGESSRAVRVWCVHGSTYVALESGSVMVSTYDGEDEWSEMQAKCEISILSAQGGTVVQCDESSLLLAIGCGDSLPFGWKPIAMCNGFGHSLCLLEDGRLQAKGVNLFGELGTLDASSWQWNEVDAIGRGTVMQFSCGGHHSLACSVDGTLYAFGCNVNGQLGVGEAIESDDDGVTCEEIPVRIPGTGFLYWSVAHHTAMPREVRTVVETLFLMRDIPGHPLHPVPTELMVRMLEYVIVSWWFSPQPVYVRNPV